MTESTEVATVETTDVATAEPQSLIRMALEQKVEVDVLERLVALEERVAERNARAAFFAALADFQENCPEIPKSKTASVVTRKGSNYQYDYAPLESITRTIREPLREHGLSYSFDAEKDGGDLIVVCILRHIDGHEERARFPVPTESNAAMSAAQKNGAALTYGRRQSLIAVLGLTAVDVDTDGADPGSMEPISEKQVADLDALADEVGADRERFLRWLGVDSLADIMERDYERAVRALMQKRNQP